MWRPEKREDCEPPPKSHLFISMLIDWGVRARAILIDLILSLKAASVSHNYRISPVISPNVFGIFSSPIFFIHMKQRISSHGLVIAFSLLATFVSISWISVRVAAPSL